MPSQRKSVNDDGLDRLNVGSVDSANRENAIATMNEGGGRIETPPFNQSIEPTPANKASSVEASYEQAESSDDTHVNVDPKVISVDNSSLVIDALPSKAGERGGIAGTNTIESRYHLVTGMSRTQPICSKTARG